MPASKFSKEFKEQIIAEVLEGSRPITNGGEHLTLWFRRTVGNWVRIWRKQHPDSGMVEASSDQVAENKRLQAELREAKMEIEFLKKAAAFFAQESR